MNQLFANKNDYGKGRNMPVHYMSERLHLVRSGLLRLSADNADALASTPFPPPSPRRSPTLSAPPTP